MRYTAASCLMAFGLFGSPPALCPTEPSLVTAPVFEQVSNARDRCCNFGCLASVARGKKELVAKKISSSNTVSVYFKENESVLDDNELEKIVRFAKQFKSDADITVVGYTDGCGSSGANKKLSRMRATEVRKHLRLNGLNNGVKVVSAGEVSVSHDPKSRRVDVGSSTSFKMYEPPPKIVADFYLIDGSGSMANGYWEIYRRAISFHMPNHAKIYVATDSCVRNGINFDSLNPKGGTEIWYAYWTIIDYMKPGQSLIIISDFDSTVPLTQRERQLIDSKVRAKGIKVRAIHL